uniref:BTAD domain-containing putative transcriptional regulator n=1 Tax=Rubrimonas sp. TaxID=2036015 RepID=UPI002FDE90C5
MALRLNLLGPFRVELDGAPVRIGGRKGVALLAYLARRGGAAPRESLMALLWPDSGDGHARASLRQTLAAVRRDLGAAATTVFSTEDQAVALAEGAVEADTSTFERFARSDATEDLQAAQALWRGGFLEGIGAVTPEFDRWVEAERGVLRAGFQALLLRLCDAHAAAGRTEDMISTALRSLALDPLQEHVHRRVMDGYRRQKRFDAALRQFESLSSLLRDELGVGPEPATVDLIREVRRMRGATGAARIEPEPARAWAAPRTPSGRPSIAVLPFVGLTDGPDAALLGEGIAEEVLVNLSRDRGLLVVSRQSSFHPQFAQAASEAIGAQLGVRFLLSGSVRIAADRIRVVSHLARCEDAACVWSETYDRDIGDIFAVQSEVARMVMATATGRIVDEVALAEAPPGGGNLDAWRLVLLGLRQLHAHTPESMRAAIDALSRAVDLAPDNGRAHGLLALALIYERWNYAAQTDVLDILPIAERALALDNRDSRAHCAMAVACLLSRDHDRAGNQFEAGLAANPNDDLLQIEYGRYLLYVDRPEDGLRRIREAMRLNPLHPDWFWNIQGRCLHLLGRHAEALAAFRRITSPAFYHFAYMAACHRALGETEAAEAMRSRLF